MFCGHQLIANAVHTHSSILAAYDDKSRFLCGDRYFESKVSNNGTAARQSWHDP